MKTTPYTFTITNTCNGKAAYNVNLETLSNTTIQNTSVRVALDDTNKLYSEYDMAEKYYDNSIESRKLTSGRLDRGESVTYNLRLWIDEKVTLAEQNKTFASKIVVNANEDFDYPEITDLNATSTINSINITYNANGDISNTCKWGTSEGTYDNTVEDATSSNCNIEKLQDNTTYYYQICTETETGNKCEIGNIKTQIKPLVEKVKVGDYIRMTPTSTSYTLPNELSGCDGTTDTCVQNTLNPSELNLWRVISLNKDGTVDMVSDRVSSKAVYFTGENGYMNFISGLNIIASLYTDEKHIEKTRHMGYSDQTEKITSTNKLLQSTAPWEKETSANSQYIGYDPTIYLCGTDESLGAGDIGYTTDYQLVNGVYGSMKANNPSGTATAYWLASRRYYFKSSEYWDYRGRFVSADGLLFSNVPLYHGALGYVGAFPCYAVRPIVTIKADTQVVSGDGQSGETAYTFD